jgi:dipeptidyl aminopeptidase/acylaminoacyl peptidase
LSDGMTTAAFLLSTTDRFAASSISTCCADPKTDQMIVGPRWEAERQRFGYPLPTEDRPEFWKPVSLAVNAPRIRSPLMMQLADDEYLRALETYTAFRYSGPPVEMYVFPGEHHVKWQPAHRLAIYQRNLDWFGFWLQGRIDPDSAKQAQYERWEALKKNARAASRTGGP